jgi:hypothetical protein
MSGESDQRIVERASFRRQLADAAQLPAFARADAMISCLRQRSIRLYLTQDECFKEVYGADGARAFWEIICSEPIELRLFVELLAVTGAPFKAVESNLLAAVFAAASGATLEEAAYIVNLWGVMLDAYRAGQLALFVGDVSPLEGSAYGWQVMQAKGQDRLKVRARNAAEWLWCTPMHRHLVPDWLAAVLRPLVQPPHPSTPLPNSPEPVKPKGTLKAVTIWFKERSDGWSDDETAPSEQRDWDAAKDYFAPGLTRDGIFRKARETTPEAWRKQGRRPPWGAVRPNLL